MLGHNEIVGRKHFDQADGRLLVTSIFHTLQGEGPYQGRSAVFVRLAKCNLACSFCDTYFDSGDWYDIPTLSKHIDEAVGSHHRANMGLVLTGGEPMLQSNIVQLLKRVEFEFDWTQIESNGTTLVPALPGSTTLVVSPKCVEKNGIVHPYQKPLSWVLDRANCLKFVLSADQSSPYAQVPGWALDWNYTTRKPIYVSPMNCYAKPPATAAILAAGRKPTIEERNQNEVVSFWTPGLLDREQNEKNHRYAAQYALDFELNLTLQMHLYGTLP